MLPAIDPSRATALHALQDSIRVDSPLPDPLVPVVQFLFQQPGWVMVGGLVLGGIAALIALAMLWRFRREILRWLGTRNRGLKAAMAGTAVAILVAMAGTGLFAMHYMEHDNDFCLGCHVMIPAGEPFVRPDTGTYLIVNRIAKESPHDSLKCHDCHEPDMMAQMKELWLWMTERPEFVPEHGKLENRVCEKCHQQGDAKESWQRVAQTAGHQVHLASDSAALRELQCTTCHALEVHRFVPVDSTCYQQGCHLSDSVGIRIGAMRAQTDLHCVTCHEFTAEPVFRAGKPAESADLTPGSDQCFGCHEMRAVLAAFDPALDPHDAKCGACHNPHRQDSGRAAATSCATAQCHADWRSVKFHTGAAHRQVAARCLTCHQPHAARVDASDCEGCHEEVRAKGGRQFTPPVPFDTTKALQQTHRGLPIERDSLTLDRLGGTVYLPGGWVPPPSGEPPGQGTAATRPSPTDTFSHRQHRELACLTCHTVQSGQGSLRFVAPRGCQICHHQAPARSRCTECHEPGALTEPIATPVQVKVGETPARERQAPFSHETHGEIRCQQCHTEAVSLETAAPVAGCTACHAEHHETERTCAACHRQADPEKAHDLASAHQGCGECHDAETVARFQPNRTFCLTCHAPETDHYEERQCTTCHFQTSPDAYRRELTRSGNHR